MNAAEARFRCDLCGSKQDAVQSCPFCNEDRCVNSRGLCQKCARFRRGTAARRCLRFDGRCVNGYVYRDQVDLNEEDYEESNEEECSL